MVAVAIWAAAPARAADSGGELANDYVFAASESSLLGCMSSGAPLKLCMRDNLQINGMIQRLRAPLMAARAAKQKGGADAVAAGYQVRVVENQFIGEVADAFPEVFETPSLAAPRLVDLVNAVALEVMDITSSEPSDSLAALFHGVTRQRVETIRHKREESRQPQVLAQGGYQVAIGKRHVKVIGGRMTGRPVVLAPPSLGQYLDVALLEAATAKALQRPDFDSLQSVHEASEALILHLEERQEVVSPELLGLQRFLMATMLALDEQLQAQTKAQPLPKPN